MEYVKAQVDLLDAQAERWEVDHARAMDCRRTEELARVAVGLWGVVKDMAARHPIDPMVPDAEAQAQNASALYHTLRRAMRLIAASARADAANGYVVDGLAAFQQAHAEVEDACAVPFDKMLRAYRQAAGGRGRPIEEVRRELQRRLHG